jgi:metallo-beta-lactamase family protein
VEAEIFVMESLSAHADADDLLKWIAKMSTKPKRVFLNHGEPNSSETLKYLLKSELNLETVIPQENEVFTLT